MLAAMTAVSAGGTSQNEMDFYDGFERRAAARKLPITDDHLKGLRNRKVT